jgi:hypothetical protein
LDRAAAGTLGRSMAIDSLNLGKLQSIGTYHLDPKPGNVLPKDWNPTD